MCAKNHDLEQCKTCLTKSVDERSKYLSTKKLYYGCLKPISKTHTARHCNQRRACKVFNEKHPMSLHGFKLKKKTNQRAVNDAPDQSSTSQDGVLKSNVIVCDKNIACASTKISAQVVSMCVVPFVIKHKDSTKEIITHAVLDSCSQGTFIVKDLVNALETGGTDQTHLRLRQFKIHPCMLVFKLGLIVYRHWKQRNSLGVKLVTLMLIKQNLVGVLWGPLLREIVVKKRWHATGSLSKK